MDKRHLGALTGLRFFAAFAIVIHHVAGRIWVDPQWLHGLSLAQGVSVFFVLSGFILAYQHPELPSAKDRLAFLWARAARIYPAHLAALVITVAVHGQRGDAPQLISNALLLHSWSPQSDYFFSYNAVSWSLSTEMAFYLAFPLLVLTRKAWMIGLAVSLLLGLGVVFTASILALPPFTSLSSDWTYQGLVMVNPLARIFEFAVGVGAAAIFRWTVSRQLGFRAATILEAMAASLLLWNVSIGIATYYPLLPLWGDAGNFWYIASLSPALSSVALILLLARGEGSLSWILSRRWFQYLGAVSFAMYLIHPTVIDLTAPRVTGASGFVIFLAITLLAAIALHEIVERPAQRFLRPLFAVRRTSSVAA